MLEEGPFPTAEEQHGSERGEHHDSGVLREQEQCEPQAGVLGEGAEDQLAVRDRHVKRWTAKLSQRGGEEHERTDRLVRQPPPTPRMRDALQGQRPRGHRDARRREHERKLIGHQLCSGAQSAEQRVFVGA